MAMRSLNRLGKRRPCLRLANAFLVLLALLWAAPLAAAVEIGFWSKDVGSRFPHAFITLRGTLDSGEVVDTNFGFTARRVSPAVLFGSVAGEVISADPEYIAMSDRHFALTLTDADYRAVLARVERWRSLPQPSYSLNRRNCVHFVAEIATLLGLAADPVPGLMKEPRSFLQRVKRDNQAAIANAAARHTAPASRR